MWAVLTMVVILLTGQGMSVRASSDLMPEPESGRQGTLAVCISRTDEDSVTFIEGVELTIYYVAALNVKNGSAEYVLEPDYTVLAIDFDGMTASDSQKAAKQLAEKAKEVNASGQTAVSGSDGRVRFKGLEQGMYLVVQTGSSKAARDYETISPFLIAVPLAEKSDAGNIWNYDVEADPKTEVVKKPSSDPSPGSGKHPKRDHEPEASTASNVTSVKTGDESPLGLLIFLAVMSGALICILAPVIMKRKK